MKSIPKNKIAPLTDHKHFSYCETNRRDSLPLNEVMFYREKDVSLLLQFPCQEILIDLRSGKINVEPIFTFLDASGHTLRFEYFPGGAIKKIGNLNITYSDESTWIKSIGNIDFEYYRNGVVHRIKEKNHVLFETKRNHFCIIC